MSGRLEGKVVFITGAARGQGRAHAVGMAQEGAKIIAVDILEQIQSNPYPLSSEEDKAETERLVKEAGSEIFFKKADVRQRDQLAAALDEGVAQFGQLNIVVANAGILPMAQGNPQASQFSDAIDVDLIGVMNAVAAADPHIADHGSIVITGSTAGMISDTVGTSEMGPGGDGYGWAKRTLMEYTEHMAVHLAPRFIRVNAMHPTNVNTHLLHNDGLYRVFRPDLEHPTKEDCMPAFYYFQAIPIPYIEPEDVANLALFLASDESRYITGQQIRIDAGSYLKWPNGPGK